MNCQPIKDILRYHKTAMPYTHGQQEKTGFWKKILFEDITQCWTLVELCHEIITVTAIHVVRPCSTDHFS